MSDRTPHPAVDRQGKWPGRRFHDENTPSYTKRGGRVGGLNHFSCLFDLVSVRVSWFSYLFIFLFSFHLSLFLYSFFSVHSPHNLLVSVVILLFMSLFRVSPYPFCSVILFFNFAVVFQSFLLSFLFNLKCILF